MRVIRISEYEELLNIAMQEIELHFLSKLIEIIPSPSTAMFQILGYLKIRICA
jgi:hypothetical protein